MEPALKDSCMFLLTAIENSDVICYAEVASLLPLSKQAWTSLQEKREKLLQDSDDQYNIIIFVHSLGSNQQTVHSVF